MKYVNIFVGGNAVIKYRRKKFLVGSPEYVGVSHESKFVYFYYNINDIPAEAQEKLKEFADYIKAEGNFFSKELVSPNVGNDSYSIRIPENYKFRIENVPIKKQRKYKIRLRRKIK